MTEKNKMLAGELYNPNADLNLVKDRLNCKKMCQKYNFIPCDKIKKRQNLIKKI